MTQLATFDFVGEGVRVIVRDGEPWFVASDVARVLGYERPDQAVHAHCKGAETYPLESGGQVRHVKIIPERDVYRLVMRSRLPSAERFEEWVVGTVLPTIRKTGGYGKQDLVAALTDPATALKIIGTYAEKVIALQGEVEASRPKVAVYDRIIETGDTVGFREACKLIFAGTGAKEHEVRGFMLKAGWIQRLGGNLAPASYGQAQGYVTTRDRQITTADGRTIVRPELRITQRGLARAIVRLNESEAAQ